MHHIRLGARVLCLVLAWVALAAGCSSSQQPQASPTAGPPALKASDLAASVRATPLLHWTGSWEAPIKGPTSGDPFPADTRFTADLRALGNGDVFGTVTIDGATADVLVLDGKTQFVKAGADYWRALPPVPAPERLVAGRWVAEQDHLLYGLDLPRLTPQRVAEDLAGIATPATTGTAAPPMPVVPADQDQPTRPPVAYPPPDGVPAGAPRLDLVRMHPSAAGAVRNGMYWFSPDAPHRLIGYSGIDLLTASDPSRNATARLTVRAGTAEEAKDAYADLAARLRSVPRTVAVNANVRLEEKWSKVTPCAPGVCGPVAVGVRLRNEHDHLTISEKITVTLYGSGSFVPEQIKDKVGTCQITAERIAPGTSTRKLCTVDDPRILRMQAKEKYVWFRAETSTTLTEVTRPSGAEKLARALP
ncbi:hypothetical protein ABZ907_41035 [Nonomuraea wenchangensis]